VSHSIRLSDHLTHFMLSISSSSSSRQSIAQRKRYGLLQDTSVSSYMSVRTEIHAKLEKEIQLETVPVQTSSRAEVLCLRLMNIVATLNQLFEDGLAVSRGKAVLRTLVTRRFPNVARNSRCECVLDYRSTSSDSTIVWLLQWCLC